MRLAEKVWMHRRDNAPLRGARVMPLTEEAEALCAVLDQELARLRSDIDKLHTERDAE